MQEYHDVNAVRVAVEDVQRSLGLKLRKGSVSFGFVYELAYHLLNGIYDVHTIYDEIGMLEANDTRFSSARGAHQFKHNPLRGLWCKHHHQSYFLIQNLIREIERAPTLRSFLDRHIGEVMTMELINRLVREQVIDAYDRRASEKRLTGEWIVFERVDDKNHYLTLGHHEEGDERVKQRIDSYRSLDSNLLDRSIVVMQRH